MRGVNYNLKSHMPCPFHVSRHPFNERISADSAVAVFSPDFSTEILTRETKQQIPFREKQVPKKKTFSELRSSVASSSNFSMEYDDLFETYPEEDQIHQHPIVRNRVGPYIENTSDESLTNMHDNNNVKDEEIIPMIGLSLVMKMKISDRTVRKITSTKAGKSEVVLTSAGNFGDNESLLLWRKEYTSSMDQRSYHLCLHSNEDELRKRLRTNRSVILSYRMKESKL
uniref:Uncharacterized protein n=1 Tax=Heterorhabditis bacteriophora TaxID=37862 RepID=A0A1I7XGY7_HETBA